MSKKDAALKLALEALESLFSGKADEHRAHRCSDAIIAIREALAEQPAQQEPVAYAVYHRMGGSKTLHWPEQHSEHGDHNEYRLVPLYEHPPALVAEPHKQPAQQQEPVAFDVMCPDCGGDGFDRKDSNYRCAACNGSGFVEKMLYTSPPASKPWVGLTDEERKRAIQFNNAHEALAVVIEAKLKEKNA